MQGRHLRSDAAAPSCQRNSPAPHSRTSLLSLCQGQTPAYAVLSLLPSLSNMGKREELRRDLVSVNCIYVLGRQGKKGNLKLSDTENGTEREGRCLKENESAITAAWQSPRATQRKRKKKNQQLMDYVCLATSYSTEQGAIPKGMWCGNSTVTHFISWTRQTLSGLHTWPHTVLSLLVLIMAKKKPCYSQKWHCTHCFLPSKHASHTPKSSKCSFYYQMLFHLWSITWRILPPLLFSCISHEPSSTWAHSKEMLNYELSMPFSSPFLTQVCFICWDSLRPCRNLEYAPFPIQPYQNLIETIFNLLLCGHKICAFIWHSG